jgi:hypothetical protein
MISRTPTLAEWPYRMVRLACDYCPRRGQYRKETLVARFGGDVLMPDVRGTSSRNARARMRQERRAGCTTRIYRNGHCRQPYYCSLARAARPNYPDAEASHLGGNMKLTILLASCSAFVASVSNAYAGPQPQLLGKSVIVSWVEDRLQREIELGEQQPRSILNAVEWTVYVSTAGRTFVRQRRAAHAGRGPGGEATSLRAPGDPAGGGTGIRAWSRDREVHLDFHGTTMTRTVIHESGALQLIVNFDAGFKSCSAQAIVGKESGKPQIVRSQITGRKLEVYSVGISSMKCSVQDGNVFSS